MFKIDKKTNKIFLTKGDNAEIEVNLVDGNGDQRQVYKDDVIQMTVRKTAGDDIAFQKTAANGVIEIVPDDTDNLPVGIYRYDIQLTTFTGKIYTVVSLAYFEIGEELTR